MVTERATTRSGVRLASRMVRLTVLLLALLVSIGVCAIAPASATTTTLVTSSNYMYDAAFNTSAMTTGALNRGAAELAPEGVTPAGLTGEVPAAGSSLVAAEDSSSVAGDIANGHAYDKHVVQQGEYQGITSRTQFQQLIQNTLDNPTADKALSGGRHAYWNSQDGTVVITDPSNPDGGTRIQANQRL
jgi:hypothetical protein